MEVENGTVAALCAHEQRLQVFFEGWMKQNESALIEMRQMMDECLQGQRPHDRAEVRVPIIPSLCEPAFFRHSRTPGLSAAGEGDVDLAADRSLSFQAAEGIPSERSTCDCTLHVGVPTDKDRSTSEMARYGTNGTDEEAAADQTYSFEAGASISSASSERLGVQVRRMSSPAVLETNFDGSDGRDQRLETVPEGGVRRVSVNSAPSTVSAPSSCGVQSPKVANKSWMSDVINRVKNPRQAGADEGVNPTHWIPVMTSTDQLMGVKLMTKSNHYEVFVALLIISNALWIGFQLQYLSVAKDHHLDSVFNAAAIFFCVAFTLELVIRLVSYMLHEGCLLKGVHVFFRGHDRKWNMFDLFVVCSTLLEQVLLFADLESGLLERISILRSVRLARLFRVVRIARVFASFREFRVLVLAITKGLRALMWTMVICTFMVYLVGICLAQGALDRCGEYTKGSGDNQNTENDVCVHFGSLDAAMMSLFKAIFGGLQWGLLLDMLDEIEVLYSIIFVMFVLFVLIVILNTVAAIFIEIQIEAAREERDTVVQDLQRNRESFVTMMTNIFQEIDMNGSGCISIDELELALEDAKMETFLSALELDVNDAKSLFQILDADGSDALSIHEFVGGCLRLRGGAKASDVALLKMHNEAMMQVLRGGGAPVELRGGGATLEPTKDDAARRVSITSVGTCSGSVTDSLRAQYARTASTTLGSLGAVPSKLFSSSTLPSLGNAKFPNAASHHHSTRSIPQVEMRAMTLKELRGVCSRIEQTCMLEHWRDLLTGDRLKPKDVNLYHFSHYQICPSTVPNGVVLEVTQAQDYTLGQMVVQPNPFNSQCPTAEGFVKEDGSGCKFKVHVTWGQFTTLHAGSTSRIRLDQDDVGELKSVSPIGDDISYKEFVSTTPAKPTWFCSHWWGEPVLDFVSCCESHAEMRNIEDKQAQYWVCAYANRQHDLGMDMSSDPEQSSFRKAMLMAGACLLILDEKATPFHRIWCGFELYRTLCDDKVLDIVTMVPSSSGKRKLPQLLSERPLKGETPWIKVQREQSFPIKLLIEGICVKLEDGEATVPSDKEKILDIMTTVARRNSISSFSSALSRANVVRMANEKLNAYFAQAAWPRAVKQGIVRDFDKANPGCLSLPDVLRQDETRRVLTLSLGQTNEMDDREVKSLADGFPPRLTEMDLSFEVCRRITDAGLIALAHRLPRSLKKLHLDFLGCEKISDRGLQELASCLPPELLHLRLDFAKCHEIGSGGVQVLAQCLPSKLQSVTATFKGTRCDRNFSTLKDLRSFM